jgi:hypothetical protein
VGHPGGTAELAIPELCEGFHFPGAGAAAVPRRRPRRTELGCHRGDGGADRGYAAHSLLLAGKARWCPDLHAPVQFMISDVPDDGGAETVSLIPDPENASVALPWE